MVKSEKMNVKFHKNCENTAKILRISCVFVKLFDNYFLGALFGEYLLCSKAQLDASILLIENFHW